MNSKLKSQLNAYEGNLAITDGATAILLPKGHTAASRSLWTNCGRISFTKINKRSPLALYTYTKGMPRLVVRAKEFNRRIEGMYVTYYIPKSNIKEIFQEYVVLHEGGVLDLNQDMLLDYKSFYQYKYKFEHGLVDAFIFPTEKAHKMETPRILVDELWDSLMQLKNEFSYYENHPINKPFIDDLLNRVANFQLPRIGKVYVDIYDNSKMVHRIYLYKEWVVNPNEDFYEFYDEVEVLLNILNENKTYTYEIKISKNR